MDLTLQVDFHDEILCGSVVLSIEKVDTNASTLVSISVINPYYQWKNLLNIRT